VPAVRSAGLERAARSAGEAFGYEDDPAMSHWRRGLPRFVLYGLVLCGLATVGLAAAML
jgi:hypothetical protein